MCCVVNTEEAHPKINKSSMSMSMSIVILTTSLRRQFVIYMPTTVSNPLLFLLKKKFENLLQSHFFNRKRLKQLTTSLDSNNRTQIVKAHDPK